MQVENIYKPFRQNNHSAIANSDSVGFYGDPEYTILISDYIQLTTVREVIKELIPSAYIRRKGQKSYLHLVSAIDGQAFEPPSGAKPVFSNQEMRASFESHT